VQEEKKNKSSSKFDKRRMANQKGKKEETPAWSRGGRSRGERREEKSQNWSKGITGGISQEQDLQNNKKVGLRHNGEKSSSKSAAKKDLEGGKYARQGLKERTPRQQKGWSPSIGKS